MSLRVIGAGLGRTGTFSLKVALETLGFTKCYHMFELFKHREAIVYWEQASDNSVVDWKSLFAGYQSTADYPACCHIEELMTVYPDAKVVLTIRDFDSWYNSAMQTILTIKPSILQKMLTIARLPFSQNAKNLLRIGSYIDEAINKKMLNKTMARKTFNEHNERIMDIVPGEKLLVYNIRDGWLPLCEFLQVAIPEIDFPHRNKQVDFAKEIKPLLW